MKYKPEEIVLNVIHKWYPDPCPMGQVKVYFGEEEYEYLNTLVSTLEAKDLLTHDIIENTLTLTKEGKRLL